MLTSSSARVVACIALAAAAIPAYALFAVTGSSVGGAGLMIVAASLATLLVPRPPAERFVTRAVRVRSGR